MIKVICTGCRKELATRDNDNIQFGAVTAKAPCDVMCNKCGRITHIPAVPTLVPAEPKPAIVTAPAVTVPVTVQPAPVVVVDEKPNKVK